MERDGLKGAVHFVHFGLVVGIEKDNPEVVEVETDPCFAVLTELLPRLGHLARDGSDNQESVCLHVVDMVAHIGRPALGKKEVECGRGVAEIVCLFIERHLGTGGTKIGHDIRGVVVLVLDTDDGRCTAVGIGQTKEQTEVALWALVGVSLGTQRGIGIVFACLKDHITDQIESKGRMHAISSAMGQTAEPNKTTVKEGKHKVINDGRLPISYGSYWLSPKPCS